MANCDGSLSSSTDFQIAANVFSEKWKIFNHGFPEWEWIDCSNRLFAGRGVADGYLSLQNLLLPTPLKVELDEGSTDDIEEPFDNATFVYPYTLLMNCLIILNRVLEPKNIMKWYEFEICKVQSTSDDDGHRYDFHVMYSASYRVPVLYFRAYSSDGQPLNLDEIEKNLPTKSVEVLTESKWTFITQEEHLYLNRPWYTLHPCGTSEWMKLLLAGDNSTTKSGTERYLVSWFSVIGQVFGLKLPLDMLKSIN